MDDVMRILALGGYTDSEVSETEHRKVPCTQENQTGSSQNISLSAFQYLQQRQYGVHRTHPKHLFANYVAQQVPSVLQEHEFSLGTINKVFAAKWLNDKQVVYGTKCNQLIVINVTNGRQTVIPSLQSSDESIPAISPCGIHAISINPSGTLLATGASNTNDIGIYRLPTFDPVCVGEGGHTDWVFDMEWIDDEFLVTGSRDSLLALWRVDNVDDSRTSRMTCLYVPEYAIKKPIFTKPCEKALKVRALTINHRRSEMAVLSLNAYFHLWDIETFHPLWINRLRCARENVCITVSEERNLYAVGSHSCFTLVDSRKKTEHQIPAKHRERGLFQGIRSLSFQKDIITIGTGVGLVMFYDIRAGKYLENPCGHPCQLLVGNGWLKHDESYQDIFLDNIYPNAIYTHAYDETGVRLFTAGGPLPAQLWGNYAALWA